MRKRNLLFLGLFALAVVAVTPSDAPAAGKPKPGPGARSGFRLFARSLGAITINRIYCGLATTGEVCVDSTNSSTIGGGFWPKGTADQYVFNSGLQIAGVVGGDGGPWAGDTTGAFFFDPKGTTQHGEQVEPIYNTTNPEDNAFISDTTGTCNEVCKAAKVPLGDVNQDLFFPLLRGRNQASQGDVWWLSWDGNPGLVAGRPHPLGILVEQRGMGWNFPSGNQDILYFLYTFYNVTASDPAVYTAAGVRPGMADILARQGAVFQQRNEAAFGITLPDGGYTVENLFAAFSADMDVAEAGSNFSSVNVPFALGYVYQESFAPAAGWTFDPSIFSPPFFPGSGFVGVKYLKSPVVAGEEVGLTLFSNTINGGAFDDAQNTTQLFRYISNNINPAAGDAPCNTGNPQETKICFVNNTASDDMRFFQSSGPLTLGPGQFGTIAVAYIFAAPRIAGACVGPGTCTITPGDARLLSNPNTADNVNTVDSVSGFIGYAGDADGDGAADQAEFTAPTPNSLLGKALVAQSVFDNGFLLPFAPESPEFFLIPGDNQVTVLWRPSPTETTGDPFFVIASSLTRTDPETGLVEPNPLYDPNYRQFDVEGYRIYRGRVDSPDELTEVAQFDYQGTVITDFTSQISVDGQLQVGCAPELGINTVTVVGTDTTLGCPVDFDSLVAGVAPTVSLDIPLVGPIIQVKRGERTTLATGQSIILIADTAITGGASGLPELEDTGVPFTFLDTGVRNNLRYFYSVTAFDINSFQSGPSSIESPRATKSVIPVPQGTNATVTGTVTMNVVGRGVAQDSVFTGTPTLDPATGRFSGPFPPADGGDLHFAGQFASQIISAPGELTATLDSLTLGSAYDGLPSTYYLTATTALGSFQMVLPVTQDVTNLDALANQFYLAVPADPALAGTFGGGAADTLRAEFVQTMPGVYYTNSWGRGCINKTTSNGFNAAGSLGCDYNGSRWFNGPSPANNETKIDPNGGNRQNSATPAPFKTPNNAGELAGVAGIHEDLSYQTVNNVWRVVEGAISGAARAADFNVYWGTGGTVDSVIDVTHNVPVAFSPTAGASWGFLNQSATASTQLTSLDMCNVEPLLSFPAVSDPVDGLIGCGGTPAVALSPTAVPGPTGFVQTGFGILNATGPGFIMYMPGHFFTFDLGPAGALPAQGTVWSLRTYTGAIRGGHGDAGNDGSYVFFPVERPYTAVGATIRLGYSTTNQVAAATPEDLRRVHTVPDPYYVTSQFEQTTDTKVIKFVNLPTDAIIRIYSSSGVLVSLLEHHSTTYGGAEDWNVRNRNNQIVASGVYFYHIEAGDARHVGRFTVVNFAQ
ncbi:MAG TPA: hypothetical protein VFB61_13400 [Gemmatimonadales bacterium]|nr:hypothetical protein [Gemmatimonadales bacterium]